MNSQVIRSRCTSAGASDVNLPRTTSRETFEARTESSYSIPIDFFVAVGGISKDDLRRVTQADACAKPAVMTATTSQKSSELMLGGRVTFQEAFDKTGGS